MAGKNKGPGMIGLGLSEFRKGGTVKLKKAEPTKTVTKRRDATASKVRKETQPTETFAARARRAKVKIDPEQ